MSSMAACTFNSLIYFGGGKNMNWSKVSDFYSINVNNKEIEKRANMLTARTTHQIAVCEERIIVIGGFDDAGNGILSIESYDTTRDQWSIITNIPGSLSKTWPQSVGVLNGTKFYISVFHTPNTFKIMQKGYYYDLETNIWSEAPVVYERARYCPTCSLTFPRKIYTFNGKNDEIIVQHHDVELFEETDVLNSQASTSSNSLLLEDGCVD
jgi:N-acetylneuraminic acid mutarotase